MFALVQLRIPAWPRLHRPGCPVMPCARGSEGARAHAPVSARSVRGLAGLQGTRQRHRRQADPSAGHSLTRCQRPEAHTAATPQPQHTKRFGQQQAKSHPSHLLLLMSLPAHAYMQPPPDSECIFLGRCKPSASLEIALPCVHLDVLLYQCIFPCPGALCAAQIRLRMMPAGAAPLTPPLLSSNTTPAFQQHHHGLLSSPTHTSLPKAQLLSCPTARTPQRPNCSAAHLPNCPTAQLPDCVTAQLPNCPTANLPNCSTAPLPQPNPAHPPPAPFPHPSHPPPAPQQPAHRLAQATAGPTPYCLGLTAGMPSAPTPPPIPPSICAPQTGTPPGTGNGWSHPPTAWASWLVRHLLPPPTHPTLHLRPTTGTPPGTGIGWSHPLLPGPHGWYAICSHPPPPHPPSAPHNRHTAWHRQRLVPPLLPGPHGWYAICSHPPPPPSSICAQQPAHRLAQATAGPTPSSLGPTAGQPSPATPLLPSSNTTTGCHPLPFTRHCQLPNCSTAQLLYCLTAQLLNGPTAQPPDFSSLERSRCSDSQGAGHIRGGGDLHHPFPVPATAWPAPRFNFMPACKYLLCPSAPAAGRGSTLLLPSSAARFSLSAWDSLRSHRGQTGPVCPRSLFPPVCWCMAGSVAARALCLGSVVTPSSGAVAAPRQCLLYASYSSSTATALGCVYHREVMSLAASDLSPYQLCQLSLVSRAWTEVHCLSLHDLVVAQ